MFKESVDALTSNLENLVSSKTVLGEPLTVGNVTIIPIIKAGFAFGTGVGEGTHPAPHGAPGQKASGCGSGTGGGAGGGVSPVAMIVIQDGKVEIYSLGSKCLVDKLADMAPEIMTKLHEKGCCC